MSAVEGADTTAAIRARLDDEMSYHRTDCCGESDEPCPGTRIVYALAAVLDELDRTEREWNHHTRSDALRTCIRNVLADALGVGTP